MLRSLLSSSKRLPEPVLAELVDILFTTLLPIIVIGITITCIGTLIAVKQGDAVILALVIAGIAVSIFRGAVIVAYHRQKRAPQTAEPAATWERRYAVGSYAFAAVLGLFNARALATGDPLIAMLITAMTFGHGAGLVARVAVRPTICVVSLMLAVVPTVIGLSIYTAGVSDPYAKAACAMLAILIAGFAAASLETVAHRYLTTLQQLLNNRDLAILAGKDALTGLANRSLLRARLDEGIARAGQTGELLAFHYLDLDRFKTVNDMLGHSAGDTLLQTVADRLKSILRVGDTAARFGGDEFVVVQSGIQRADEARLLARRIVRVLSAPYNLEGEEEAWIGVSVGVALAPRDGLDLENLASRADAALYRAKNKGRGAVVVWGEASSSAETTAA
jgi:diguanylate cyclase